MDYISEKEDVISKILTVSEVCSRKLDLRSLESIAAGLLDIPGLITVHFCLKDSPFFVKAIGESCRQSNCVSFGSCHSDLGLFSALTVNETPGDFMCRGRAGITPPADNYRLPITHFDKYYGTIFYEADRPLDEQTNRLLKMAIDKLALNMFNAEEAARQELINELYRLMASRLSLEMLFLPLLKEFFKVITFECAALIVPIMGLDKAKILCARNESGRLIPVKESAKLSELWASKALVLKRIVTNKDFIGDKDFIDYKNLENKGYSNMLALPLVSGDKSLGVLCFSSSRSYDPVHSELGFLTKISSNLAVMLERQTYYDQLKHQKEHLKQQAKEISVSREITRSILSTRKIDELLNSVISQVRRLVDCDGINMLIKSTDSRDTYVLPKVDLATSTISIREGLCLRKRDTALTLCLQTKEPVIWEDLTKAPLTSMDREITEREKIGATITFPLIVDDRPLGVLVINFMKKRLFFKKEIKLAQELAQEVAVALARAMQRLEEKKILLTLQSNFASEEPPVIDGWTIATHYASATRHSVVGGDFYDFIQKDERLYIVVGDVCGKGIKATATTLMVKHALRAFLFEHDSLSKVVSKLNTHLIEELKTGYEGFIALFVAELNINKGTVKYIRAGQPPPLVLSDHVEQLNGTVLDSVGFPPLGIFSDIDYKVQSIKLPPGSSLFIYTDGLPEVGAYTKAPLGTEGIIDILASIKDAEPDRIIKSLIQRVMDEYKAIDDDVAVVLIKNQKCQTPRP